MQQIYHSAQYTFPLKDIIMKYMSGPYIYFWNSLLSMNFFFETIAW